MKADTVQFTISAEEVVVNTTVKIIATVDAIVTTDMTELKLKEAIRDVMQNFIVTDWQFSGMTRVSDRARMEKVSLTATARVPEIENYQLAKRSQAASRDGLAISSAVADTTPPASQIEETQSKLRKTILEKALAELEGINTTLSATYRLGKVVFDPVQQSLSNTRAMMASANYGSGFDAPAGGGQSDIGNAVKVTMTAMIQLRA